MAGLTYLRRTLLIGFRHILGKPIEWGSSVIGLFGVPGVLMWVGWGQLIPAATIAGACLTLCAALAIGGYRLHQDDQRALLSGLNERQRRVAEYAEQAARSRPFTTPVPAGLVLNNSRIYDNDIGIQVNN